MSPKTADAEGDRISIYTESDMDICIEHGGAIPKIYIVVSAPEEQVPAPAPTANAEEPIASSSTQTDSGAAATAATATAADGGCSGRSGLLHPNVICDGCNEAVRGVRYKCAQCADYDLCHACEQLGRHSHHMMYRMSEPMPDISSHIERRLSKWLRKHMPANTATAAAATAGAEAQPHPHLPSQSGGCRRSGRRTACSWATPENNFGRYHRFSMNEPTTCPRQSNATTGGGAGAAPRAQPTPTAPQTQQPRFNADRIAEALSQARTAEKAASAGLDLLSKFSSILDPFSVHLGSAPGGVGAAGGQEGCPFEAVTKAVGSVAANVFEAAAAATAAAAAATAAPAAAAAAPAAAEQPQQQPQDGTSASAAAAEPASPTPRQPAASAPASPAKSDDFENVSVRSGDSMDSVLEALMEATKEAKNLNKLDNPEPDVD